MQNLKVEFENCYGIKKLNKEFNFTTENKVNVIYAKNGLMKTSFAKIFKKYQEGKESEIKDIIFNNTPVVKNIKVDNIDINKNEIFVINSFEKAYESGSISSLLINDNIKIRLSNIVRIKKQLFEDLEEKSELNIFKGFSTKGLLKLEEQILKDFGFVEQSFLHNLENIDLNIDYDYSTINYSLIFHKSVVNNIKKADFQNHINDYIERSNEIYSEYSFFEKEVLIYLNLKVLKKNLILVIFLFSQMQFY